MTGTADSWFQDIREPSSPASTASSFDEEEVNCRIKPYWPKYNNLLRLRGFRLDTVRDVKEHYRKCNMQFPAGVRRTFSGVDDDALCPDPGLHDNLFRGERVFDGTKIIVKAVSLRSREFDIISFLSSPSIRSQPMNHCIPVLDLVQVHEDSTALIVMEEWSSQLIPDDGPCSLRLFLEAIRQCIEHAVFMHRHNIAHLDISLHNLVTDYKGHYAYIDFELSQRFEETNPQIRERYRGTEVPPECEKRNCIDPYKIDVWALAILILRACKLTGYCVPELVELVKPMLHENPDNRPSMMLVLRAFDLAVSRISPQRLAWRSHLTRHDS
ncbi:hypothetical protein K435DRAFT_841348 [Dendrothele bispora CBS 962.96]|uniref:Protein kinase domain-containing protein n=1 Tax=Dendrothele bispora (strain CBS 962.96) TaxID=1314807 RepID=A0A4S8LN23_DENBC|nr:hypothetical protein K435DRAFT_841348 [Dendrothele bispora CBS 962.96]